MTGNGAATGAVIGLVESVSPSEVTVLLDQQAPQSVAIVAGSPIAFPRLNSWILMPSEGGHLLGLVTWLGFDRGPGRSPDAQMLPLSTYRRRLRALPVGVLRYRGDPQPPNYEVDRGVISYPAVGSEVVMPTRSQLQAIAPHDGRGAFIGVSPICADAEVTVGIDTLFGRHVAILGNTGTGKSCTVAGLVRWSVESTQRGLQGQIEMPTARFIILDPNGEYAQAFDDLNANVFRVDPDLDELGLTVPGWIWTSAEWTAFTRASPQTQRPLLQLALRNLRNGWQPGHTWTALLATQLRGFHDLWSSKLSDPDSFSRFPRYKDLSVGLHGMCKYFADHPASSEGVDLTTLVESLAAVAANHPVAAGTYDRAYGADEVRDVVAALSLAIAETHQDGLPTATYSEDAPIEFDVARLPDHLDAVAKGVEGVGTFASYLVGRIRILLEHSRIGAVLRPQTETRLAQWLGQLIGSHESKGAHIAVLDLSLLSKEAAQTIAAVIARVSLDALQHFRRLYGAELPTVLVVDEAHTVMARAAGPYEQASPGDLARDAFERIAREGRKFGLGLVISSQRPSDLSPTILSQCNTFIVHRLGNERDLEAVHSAVPDSLASLLTELPNLAPQWAVALGAAVPLPTVIRMRDLESTHRPASTGPSFWDDWASAEPPSWRWQNVIESWIAEESLDQVTQPASEGAATRSPHDHESEDEPPF